MTTQTTEPQIFTCAQYSPEWWELRRGVPTASAFDRILTAAQMKPSAQQDDYIAELIAEKAQFVVPYMPAEMDGGYVNSEMEEGIRREPEARSWYAMERGVDLQQVGFVLSACGRFGCSPDALVGDEGGLELKNPSPKVHLRYLLKGTLPNEYKCQVHGSMIVARRLWWDFLSYCPGFAPLLIRVKRDDFTAALHEELERFHAKYVRTQAQVSAM